MLNRFTKFDPFSGRDSFSCFDLRAVINGQKFSCNAKRSNDKFRLKSSMAQSAAPRNDAIFLFCTALKILKGGRAMRRRKVNWSMSCRLTAALLMVLFATPLLAQTITLSIPDTAARSRSLLKLPIRVSDVSGLGIVSLSLKLAFDPNVLDALGANSKGTISQVWGNPTTSDSTGQITLVMVGATPLSGQGILTYVFFDVIGARGDTTSIKFKMVSVNDGRISAVVSSSKFTTLEAEPSPNARFSMPDTSGNSGGLIELPIRVSDLSRFKIDSLRIGISYNKYVMQTLEVMTSGTLAQNWQIQIETKLPGTFAFMLKGSASLPDSGVLCRIRCELKGNPGMSTPVHFQNISCYNDSMRIASRDGKVTIAGGVTTQVSVSIPDISADSANTVTVPVFVSPLSQQHAVSAVSIALTFDPQVITYKSYSVTNTMLDGWFCSSNIPSPGLLKFGAFSASCVVGQGVLVEFMFQVVGRPAMQTALAFSEMVFNEGSPSATVFSGVFTVNYVIPVELIEFRAEQAGNAILLIWSTATESNNYGFEIERSVNGSPWRLIGFVPGHGSTAIPHHYEFRDPAIATGIHLYQLKQIDYDGHFVRTAPIQIVIAPPKQYSLGQNYPNPFNSSTKIPFDLPEPAQIKLTLYDLLGKQVGLLATDRFDAGHHHISFQSDRLAAGLYFYELRANQFVAVKKLLIVK